MPGYAEFQVRPQPEAVEWASVTLPTQRGPIGAAFRTIGERTDVGVHVPGNSTASVFVPASAAASDTVYVDGEAVPAERVRGYLRVDGVGSGCHTLSTVSGREVSRDKRLQAVCVPGQR